MITIKFIIYVWKVPDQSLIAPTTTTATILHVQRHAEAPSSLAVLKQSSNGYKSLNVTANTIMSNYNNASVITTATAMTTTGAGGGGGGSSWMRRLNPNQVDMCKKFARTQIDIAGKVLMEGTYSLIQEARLTLVCDDNALNSAEYDNRTVDTAATTTDEDEKTVDAATTSADSRIIRVMIKTVNERASREQAERMLVESAMLRGVKQKNLNAIMGVCVDHTTNVFMSVFPYYELGNLKTYLIEIRNNFKCDRNNSNEV